MRHTRWRRGCVFWGSSLDSGRVTEVLVGLGEVGEVLQPVEEEE